MAGYQTKQELWTLTSSFTPVFNSEIGCSSAHDSKNFLLSHMGLKEMHLHKGYRKKNGDLRCSHEIDLYHFNSLQQPDDISPAENPEAAIPWRTNHSSILKLMQELATILIQRGKFR